MDSSTILILLLINLVTLILVINGIQKGKIKFAAKKIVVGVLVTILIINVINFILMQV